MRRLLRHPCRLPRLEGGSASTSVLSRPAQASLTLQPAGSLNRPRRPSSRGFNPASHPAKPLVSYQGNRQFPGWNPPPLVKRAFGAHFQTFLWQFCGISRTCNRRKSNFFLFQTFRGPAPPGIATSGRSLELSTRHCTVPRILIFRKQMARKTISTSAWKRCRPRLRLETIPNRLRHGRDGPAGHVG